MKEMANDNFRGWNARKSTAASEGFLRRPDLVELAMASNAHIAELQRQIVALNDARLTFDLIVIHRSEWRKSIAFSGSMAVKISMS